MKLSELKTLDQYLKERAVMSNARERFMFWLWDARPFEWPTWLVRLVSRLACVLAGHEPMWVYTGPHHPDRDLCAWCYKPMPDRPAVEATKWDIL